MIPGNLLVCGGLNFPGGLDFEERKALFWHWIIPFYVLERQKCVNVRNICPSRMIVGFSGFRQRILQGEGTDSGGLS